MDIRGKAAGLCRKKLKEQGNGVNSTMLWEVGRFEINSTLAID
jgi:hypothetical protein